MYARTYDNNLSSSTLAHMVSSTPLLRLMSNDLPFTDQIKIRKQRIRSNIRTRNARLKVLHFGRLLRLHALLYALVSFYTPLQPLEYTPFC